MPYAENLEKLALPQTSDIINKASGVMCVITPISKSFSEVNYLEYKNINGLIPVFFNENDNHFSFVKPIPNSNKCAFVTEKKRVSNLCSIGAYYFANAELIVNIFNKYYWKEYYRILKSL